MVLARLLCSESHETEVKVSTGLTSYLESLGGKESASGITQVVIQKETDAHRGVYLPQDHTGETDAIPAQVYQTQKAGTLSFLSSYKDGAYGQ